MNLRTLNDPSTLVPFTGRWAIDQDTPRGALVAACRRGRGTCVARRERLCDRTTAASVQCACPEPAATSGGCAYRRRAGPEAPEARAYLHFISTRTLDFPISFPGTHVPSS